ncbi:hypothetical protein PCANB_001070 [Pneumocystis canis]|nr:hypothetical protein PCANB_001070 [Pneumocystis canis]
MKNKNISQDEMNIYDRQIRLWGIQAQTRIRGSRVLLIHIRELAEEIAKNLVLAGIDSLTLLDDEKIENIEPGTHFCIEPSDIGMNYADAISRKLKQFNPSVTLCVNTTPISKVHDDYFSLFDVVIVTELGLDLMKKVPGHPEKTERFEYTAHYYPLSEVIEHQYGKTFTEKHKKKISPLLPGILEINEKLALSNEILKESELIQLAKNANHKWMPIASVIGGILAQDVLNVLSKQERPIQNWFFFDGEKCMGPIYEI